MMLRRCHWNGAECERWDADVLKSGSALPEELKLAILGARRKVLFVEGKHTSLDRPFYSALFSDVSVVSMRTCQEVERAVRGLRSALDIHYIEALGVIDRDNRGRDNLTKLVENGVIALDVYSVEGLYYCSEAIEAVARWQARAFSCIVEELVRAVRKKTIEKLQNREFAERMAAHRCERQIREQAFSKLPDWKLIKKDAIQRWCVSIESGFSYEVKRYTESVEAQNLDELVARYPLRETGVFDEIAKALKCRDRWDYERMVVARIQDDKKFRDHLKKRLRPLVDELATRENTD